MRGIAVALLLLTLLSVLTGCGSSSKSATLTVNEHVVGDNWQEEGYSMGDGSLTTIANMMASVYASDFNVQEMLVAANRGYDITTEEETDYQNKEFPDIGPNLEVAKKVITLANDKAADKDKIDTGLLVNFNEKDLSALVRAFASEAQVDAKSGGLDTVLCWIGIALNWITETLGGGFYIIGICIFAILTEIAMLPFAIKQQKNSIRQAKLRPKEMAIKNKYRGRNDQVTMQKMQKEIQDLYVRENFSPYSGCLPLLVQLPILMALYPIVLDPLHYGLGQSSTMAGYLTTYFTAHPAAGGLGMSLASGSSSIEVLSAIGKNPALLDGLKEFSFFSNGGAVFEKISGVVSNIPNFNIGSINFGLTPSFERFDVLLLVPVLTFVAYFFSSKITRKFTAQPVTNEGIDARQAACSNTMMDVTMPLMSTFFTFMVPALIGVYWVFRSLVGLAKTYIMSKVMPLPVFTEEDYKAAEKEMKSNKHVEHVVKKSENVGKVRSLHHIDDEDYEDTRERALARKAAIEERERLEREAKEKKTPIGGAPLKKSKQEEQQTNKKDSENE